MEVEPIAATPLTLLGAYSELDWLGVDAFSGCTTSACRFFISVTDLSDRESPSLDANDIDSGDV